MPLLDPDRLFPAEPALRDLARGLYESIRDLPIISPHGHCDPRWFAQDARFPDPAALFVTPDHYVVRMLVSHGVTHAELGVSADYYGVPKDPAAPGLDPDLGVWLGGEMETVPAGNRSVTMKGKIDAARVAREVAGDARVRVMAFPVRAYAAQSVITCSEFDEVLPIAVETGGTVHCTLTGK